MWMNLSQTCFFFEAHEKFHGQEHVQDDVLLGRPSTVHTDAMLKILSRLSIRAIAEEVGIDEMTQARIPSRRSEFKPSRPFFTISPVSLVEERPERSSSWTASQPSRNLMSFENIEPNPLYHNRKPLAIYRDHRSRGFFLASLSLRLTAKGLNQSKKHKYCSK